MFPNLDFQWFSMMGPMGWPLLLCSIFAGAIVLDRVYAMLSFPQLRCGSQEIALESCLHPQLPEKKQDWRYGVYLLASNQHLPHAQREELMGCWVMEERLRLSKRLRFLQLLGALAPLIGLLGTVLGMVSMFSSIATIDQPVTPTVLASGLWPALYTTVWGLLIAIPALLAGQGLLLWVNGYVEQLTLLLNRCQLVLDGVLLESAEAVTLWQEQRAV